MRMKIISLKPKWKTIIAMTLIAVASFTIASYANRVVVQQVQPIGGNHVTVPAPELQVLNTIWNINVNQSLVTGLILNVTTVGGTGLSGVRLYSINIQVSCQITALPVPVVRPNCAVGQVSIKLPVNLSPGAALVPVSIAPAIDPEKTEIDDLSFIVTASPDATLNIYPWASAVIPLCYSDFSMIKEPSFVTLGTTASSSGSAPVNILINSLCNYTGTVTITASPMPGLTATIVPDPVVVPKNGFVQSIETISSDGTLAPGLYPLTNVATDTSGNVHTWTIVVQIV